MKNVIWILTLALLLSVPAAAEVSVTKTATISLFGENYETADEARAVVLAMAKEAAVQEIFGEFIRSFSQVENYALTSNDIKSTSVGFIRVRGNPRYFPGEALGEVCVTIDAYVNDEDLDTLNPRSLHKKVVVADPNLTLKEVEQEAKKQARLQALIEYDNNLKKYDPEELLPLLHEVKFTDGHFIEGTTAYSIEMHGIIYPLETLALQSKEPSVFDVVALVASLPQSAFKASSYHANDAQHAPWQATFASNAASNWSAGSNDTNQWLRIDLGGPARIAAIGTAGRRNGRYQQWVTSYKVSYSKDGTNWTFYPANDDPKVFRGNADKQTEVRHDLAPPITARYVRFHPVTWHDWITMRVEIYGAMKR